MTAVSPAFTSASEQIQQRLRLRRAELVGRSVRVERDLERKNEALSADSQDRAIQQENDEPLNAIGTAAAAEIVAIDAALDRIAHNLYGVCKGCGQPIAPNRLLAVPYATTCVGCTG